MQSCLGLSSGCQHSTDVTVFTAKSWVWLEPVISQLPVLTGAMPRQVEKLSIIPRSGGALGFTYSPPKAEDKALMFDNEMRAQLAVLMGGRAAEALTCNFISNGASAVLTHQVVVT